VRVPLTSRFSPATPNLPSHPSPPERGAEGARLVWGEGRVQGVGVTSPEDGGDGGGCENSSASGR